MPGIAAALVLSVVPTPVAAAVAATDDYIVVLRNGVDVTRFAALADHRDGVQVEGVFRAALKGLHARLSPAASQSLSRDPAVLFLSPNRSFTAEAQTLPTGVNRIDADQSSAFAKREAVSTPVAVFDSGIAPVGDLNVQPGVNCTATLDTSDRYGHGTHVAGIIGAKNNVEGVVGVAAGAPLHPVKVLDDRGNGSDASILCGIEWATTVGRLLGVRVANLSLSTRGVDDGNCGLSQRDPIHLAICNATAAGILFVAAAGNAGARIDTTVPAAYDEVLTVTWMNDYNGTATSAATPAGCSQFGPDDTYSGYSNFVGHVADQPHSIAAPGSCITSTSIDGGTVVASGSSMAAPHVTGTVALCLHTGACTGTPGQVMQQVRSTAAAASSARGFTGDPSRPRASDIYYGDLVYAGA